MLRRIGGTDTPRGFAGGLDGIEAGVIAGWARDDATPERKVIVEILWNGIRVGITVADHLRAGAEGGDPEKAFCAFRFALPRHLIAEGGQVGARVANTGIGLGEIGIGAAPGNRHARKD